MKNLFFQLLRYSFPVLLISLISCQQEDPSVKLKPLVDKYVEIWNTGNLEGIEKVIHPDFELRMAPKFEPEKGIDKFEESVKKWRAIYPDFHITVHEVVYGTNKAAARWTITATHTGEGWGPPTGKHVNVMGISIIHFKDGKVKDEWIAGNNLYWMQQLGYKLVPPSEE